MAKAQDFADKTPLIKLSHQNIFEAQSAMSNSLGHPQSVRSVKLTWKDSERSQVDS